MSRPQRRFVKLVFNGYVPCELAIQVHSIGKNCKKNQVGGYKDGELVPYEEYTGDYEHLKNRNEPIFIHIKSIYDLLKSDSFCKIQEKILEELPDAKFEDEIYEFDLIY